MQFLGCLAAAGVCSLTGGEKIRQKRLVLRGIAVVLAVLAVLAAGMAWDADIALLRPLTTGSLATAFFVVVMAAGACGNSPAGRYLRKKWMPIRGEFSIYASILTLGHNVAAGRVYFVQLFTRPGDMPGTERWAAVCSAVMLLLMVPLFVLSFPAVRKKMDARLWKNIQRTAYLFYALLYVHVLLLFVPMAREGSVRAWGNVLVFSAVFLGYAAARIGKALSGKDAVKNAGKKRLCVVLAVLLTVGMAAVSVPADWISSGGEEAVSYADGVYTGHGRGYAGTVEVQVTVTDGRMTDIQVTEHREDEPYWQKSLVTIERILTEQKTRVDTVAGATKSCRGLQRAVRDALKQAER